MHIHGPTIPTHLLGRQLREAATCLDVQDMYDFYRQFAASRGGPHDRELTDHFHVGMCEGELRRRLRRLSRQGI